MTTALQAAPVDYGVIDAIVDGQYHDPHSVLGPHPYDGACTIRLLRPFALSVVVITADGRHAAKHEHRGVWTVVLPGADIPDYRVEVRYSGDAVPADDPYRFMPTLSEFDLHLFHGGQLQESFNVLGAHPKSYASPMGDVHGTAFAVWAPNARGVQVVGNFNHWDGSAHPMRSMGVSGVWELFVPFVGEGEAYKFRVTGREDADRGPALPQPVQDLLDAYREVSERRLVECWHDALTAREQCLQMFNLGLLSLELRGLAERLYWATCARIRDLCRRLDEVPEELEGIETILSDIYFCNMSVFQSLPDSWAIDHLFPILPSESQVMSASARRATPCSPTSPATRTARSTAS